MVILAVSAIGCRSRVDPRLARMKAARHTLTAAGHASPFERASAPDVRLDVDLGGAPVGVAVDLTCEWMMPSGGAAHENRWTTKAIDRDPWPTHCHWALGSESPTGTWTVAMKQDGRVLVAEPFELR